MKLKCLIMFIALFFSVLLYSNEKINKWTEQYDNILRQHVKQGNKKGISLTVVDYDALRNNQEFIHLKYKLANLPSVENESRDIQIAFWINVYNYLTILKVVENPGIKKLTDLNGIIKNVWQQPAGTVCKKEVTLDEIEHQILRKNLKEPRIHFAIVCAALSCPNLRMEAYTSKELYKQLDDQLYKFINNEDKGMKIDNNNRIIYLSKIFMWFKGDFQKTPLEWLINKGIISDKYKNYKVKFLNYDWELNKL